ncbi:MAG: hypothetical protein ACK456_05235 [Pseudanabaenaceae cyanobacterium]|jgi:hypothetical protein
MRRFFLLTTTTIATLATAGLFTSTAMAQNPQNQRQPQNQPQNQPQQNQPLSTNWADFPNLEKGFMDSCMGQAQLPPNQRVSKSNFCQCAMNSYKSRYTPELFLRINALAVQGGQPAITLTGLMMEPELNACSVRTGFNRS